MMLDQTRKFLFVRDKTVCLMASNGNSRPQIEKRLYLKLILLFFIYSFTEIGKNIAEVAILCIIVIEFDTSNKKKTKNSTRYDSASRTPAAYTNTKRRCLGVVHIEFYQTQTKKIHFFSNFFFLRGDKINFFALKCTTI